MEIEKKGKEERKEKGGGIFLYFLYVASLFLFIYTHICCLGMILALKWCSCYFCPLLLLFFLHSVRHEWMVALFTPSIIISRPSACAYSFILAITCIGCMPSLL